MDALIDFFTALSIQRLQNPSHPNTAFTSSILVTARADARRFGSLH